MIFHQKISLKATRSVIFFRFFCLKFYLRTEKLSFSRLFPTHLVNRNTLLLPKKHNKKFEDFSMNKNPIKSIKKIFVYDNNNKIWKKNEIKTNDNCICKIFKESSLRKVPNNRTINAHNIVYIFIIFHFRSLVQYILYNGNY